MPVGDSGNIGPGNTGRQFAGYLEQACNNEKLGAGDPLAPHGHELLFSRNWFFNRGTSLHFGPKRWWWVQRQVNRLRTRSEVARLIDAQFGDDTVIVKGSRLRPDESIGDHIMKECAHKRGRGFFKIDEAVIREIAHRISAVKGEIAQCKEDNPSQLDGSRKPFLLSKDQLETIYAREPEPLQPVEISEERIGEAEELLRRVRDGQHDAVGELKQLAGAGEPRRQFALYKARINRLYPDYVDGLQWLLRAAAQNHREALEELAYLKQNGPIEIRFTLNQIYGHGLDPVRMDMDEALSWYDGPDLPSFKSILTEFWHVFGGEYPPHLRADCSVPADPDVTADYYLRCILQTDLDRVEKQPEELVRLKYLAKQGSPSIQYKLAMVFERMPEHLCLESDNDEYAEFWYRAANDAGYTTETYGDEWARKMLPLLRAAQRQDGDAARAQLELIKNNGPTVLQYEIAQLYRTGGDDILLDPSKAVTFYEIAAKSGHAAAQFRLGMCKKDGTGCQSNPAEAAFWIARAVMKDYGPAKEELSRIKRDGPREMQLQFSELLRTSGDGIDWATEEEV